MATLDDRYRQMFTKSAQAYEEAKGLFPGGITHQNRYASPFPVYFTHASAGLKWDLDGHEVIDYVMGNGALLLGHAHPQIVAAVTAQMAQGSHLGGNTQFEMEWARAIKRLVPAAETVRFTNSGTESTYLALRLARAATGKHKLIKFSEHFHGWHEYALPDQGNSPAAAVPQAVLDLVIVLPPDLSAVEEVLASETEIAAVILEPTGAHYGCFSLHCDTFLPALRQLTEKYGVLLIFDEVITGFRVSPGGAQVRYGVTPDLTTFGKIVAGGMPGAAVAGKAEIMDMMAFRGDPAWDNRRRIGQGGTFNANPPTAVAGITALNLIATEPMNQRADALAERLKAGLNTAFQHTGIPGHAYGVASMVNPVLGVDDHCDRQYCDLTYEGRRQAMTSLRCGALTKAMLTQGVHVMGGQVFMVSAVHTEAQIDRTIDAFEHALRDLRAEGIV
jgi:glutamate-1-semialdehyde 2,1-aminomutase